MNALATAILVASAGAVAGDRDPVCGKEVDAAKPAKADFKGLSFSFCSVPHREEFRRNPDGFFRAVSNEFRLEGERVIGAYLRVQEALAGDDLAGLAGPAREASESLLRLSKLEPDLASRARESLRSIAREAVRGADRVAAARSLESARDGFRTLSDHLLLYVRQFDRPEALRRFECIEAKRDWSQRAPVPRCPFHGGAAHGEAKEVRDVPPSPVQAFHCDMAGASWLQRTADVRNPYYGPSMLRCGSRLDLAADSRGGHRH